MSIFKKASELNKLPDSVSNAYFDQPKNDQDEFEELLKSASSNKGTYESRINGFKKTASTSHDFTPPQQANYSEIEGGIRRAGYGKRFGDEASELFGQEKIRSLAHDVNQAASGLSIWDPEFDVLQEGFKVSQDQQDSIFDRRTMMEKRVQSNNDWQKEARENVSLRKTNILPHRGLGVVRTSNEMPIHHNNFNSVDEFYADAQDGIRGLVKKSNEERKSLITRQGVSPEERREMWENKESVAARTMDALNDSSFLNKFTQGMSTLDE